MIGHRVLIMIGIFAFLMFIIQVQIKYIATDYNLFQKLKLSSKLNE